MGYYQRQLLQKYHRFIEMDQGHVPYSHFIAADMT